MIRTVDIREEIGLEDYAGQAYLAAAVQELKAEAQSLEPLLRGRKIWMVNSTEKGGGVAEMLPKVIRLLRDLGFPTDWAVMETRREEFFVLTKRLHNLIHGSGDPDLGAADRELYDAVSRETAGPLAKLVSPGDFLVIHDPQPMGAGALVRKEKRVTAIWRCHIGLDEDLPQTQAAWSFLEPYSEAYDHSVFSATEYIPAYLAGRASVIPPAIDPASFKNRELAVTKLVGILCNSGLMREHHPVLRPEWDHAAQRLLPDGSFTAAVNGKEIGLGFRPIVLQVSRWDRLKGWRPLMQGFAKLKGRTTKAKDPRNRRRLRLARLVLAGPDPASVQDDPEGKAVLDELRKDYAALPPAVQKDIALLALPMASRKENALMVNVLQRCASLVVQNSIREGFGLTVTEAMWKRTPVLGSNACGVRLQIRNDLEGRINPEPEDPDTIADLLDEMLQAPHIREIWGSRAQRRVYDEFLVFAQVRRWLKVMAESVEKSTRRRTKS